MTDTSADIATNESFRHDRLRDHAAEYCADRSRMCVTAQYCAP